MAFYSSPGGPSPQPDQDQTYELQALAPKPTGGFTSPGFPSPQPTPIHQRPTGGYTSPGFPTPKQPPVYDRSGPFKPIPAQPRDRMSVMRDAIAKRKMNKQLMGSWLGAQKSPVGQDQPLRLDPAIKQNPYIKIAGAHGRGRRLGRGWAGGRRFQRNLGNAYGQFLKGGAIDQDRGFTRPMPSKDFSGRIRDLRTRRNLNVGRAPGAPTPLPGLIGQTPSGPPTLAPTVKGVNPSWAEQYGRHAR